MGRFNAVRIALLHWLLSHTFLDGIKNRRALQERKERLAEMGTRHDHASAARLSPSPENKTGEKKMPGDSAL